MNTILLTDVIIPESRIRRSFDATALQELAHSIIQNGLFHPIVLRNDGRTLVCGERRLRAASMAKIPSLPYTTLAELSEDRLLEVELEENILRKDLTWQEVAQARASLHALRVRQDPTHTMRDTAIEITGVGGSQTSEVRDQIILANNMHDPDVRSAPDAKKALSVIRKKNESAILAAIGRGSAVEQSPHTIVEGDALAFTMSRPDNTFSLIITDPPYGIDMRNSGQALNQHNYDDTAATVGTLMEALIPELYRTAAAESHLYMFCDITKFNELSLLLSMAGFWCWPKPLIWYKGNQGFLPRPDHGPRRTYEAIIFCIKGNRPVEVRGAHDVISIPADSNLIHGAQKPVTLYAELMNRSGRPGETVFDPFCGSGTVFAAATGKSMIATGVELNPEAYAKARAVMTGAVSR